MATYNLYDARNTLSDLVDRAEHGEEIVIARRGVPAVRLVPVERKKPTFGEAKGLFTIPDSFFDPLPDDELPGLG